MLSQSSALKLLSNILNEFFGFDNMFIYGIDNYTDWI